MVGARSLAALTLALALAACGRPAAPQVQAPAPGAVEDAAPPLPPAPGNGYLKLRKIYDWMPAGFPAPNVGPYDPAGQLNGAYNYPEPIFGGWPILVTPVDASGNPTGSTQKIGTLQEINPTDGRYVEVPAGRYKVEERLPASTLGGGVWSVTGANSSLGSTTTAAGVTTSQFVTVAAGETTVARFLNVCRVNGVVQTFPEEAQADINAYAWVCLPYFDGTPPPGGSAGSLDEGFGAFGMATTDFDGVTDSAYDVVVQPDGKIVAVGTTEDPGAINSQRLALARHTPDGLLDPGFGAGGRVTMFRDARFGRLTLQPDGKIVVASGFLARFNADGSPDSSFGGDGTRTFDLGERDRATAVAVQPDGKIVAAGNAVLRLNADGSLDSSFGTGGRSPAEFDEGGFGPSRVALQGDGKIVVASNNTNRPLARLNPDGSLDPSFGNGGYVTAQLFGPESTGVRGLAIAGDGKIVVAASINTATGVEADPTVARLNADGTPNSGFGNGGYATADFFGLADSAQGVALQTDGKIVVAGGASRGNDSDFGLARFLP